MKLATALTALALLAAGSTANATADGCAIVLKTPDGFLNMRAAPMASSKIVNKLVPGDRLFISGDATCETKGSLSICNNSGEWTQVNGVQRLDRKKPGALKRGWVSTRFLRFVECED